METKFLNKIRESLILHKTNLVDWLKSNNSAKNLQLGINGKRNEGASENLKILSKINSALNQVEHGTFGKCALCNEEVEAERLILDFTTCVCLDHYSNEQVRELERDLELAAKVQRHMLPASLPALEGVEMAVFTRPAGAVGGDYYDFFRYKDCCQGLAIADVMGKGVAASMLVANLQASIRIMGPDFPELSLLATRLNELFRYNLKLIQFITLFLAGFDPALRTLHYVNAGHHPPLVWSAENQSLNWLKPTGPAVGFVPNAVYSSECIQLNDGDILIMYTDGLVEARNASKQEFDLHGIANYTSANFTKSPEMFLNGLLDEVELFGAEIQDDLTLMVLKLDALV